MKFNFSDREEAISSIEDSIELIVDCYSKDSLLDNYLDDENPAWIPYDTLIAIDRMITNGKE